jgi:hypothetical protein
MAAVAEVSGEAAAANNMDSRPKSESELNVQKLVDMFKKLNPLAKEFFPSSYSHHQSTTHYHNKGQLSPNFFPTANKPSSNDNFSNNRRVLIILTRSLIVFISFLLLLIFILRYELWGLLDFVICLDCSK